MTKKQQEEFARLELAYLQQVYANNAEGQLRQMEVIFYWVKKQVTDARARVIVDMPYDPDRRVALEITDEQKSEFAFLQIAMIKAQNQGDIDKVAMAGVEKKMREWIDIQIQKGVNLLIKPKLKILRDGGKN